MITTGSVQAPERLYWGTAATLAKHGYVVLTYDTQGQGRSDTFGEGVDRIDGVPSQAGRPFYDGTEDALDFLLSTAGEALRPAPELHHRHRPLARSRTAASPRASTPPSTRSRDLVDPTRVGIAGHSLGAAAVSYVGQIDDRVDAIAAWDNLRARAGSPAGPAVCAVRARRRARPNPPITKPALGHLQRLRARPRRRTPPTPTREAKNAGFVAYKAAGVDSMEFNIRGGTHYESSFIPGQHHRRPRHSRRLRGHGHGRLVHDRLVRQVRQVRRRLGLRGATPTGACSPTAGATTRAAARST